MPADRNWVKLNILHDLMTQVHDEFVAIIEADPSVTAQLKRAVESLDVAQDPVHIRVVPPYDPHLLAPSHYVAEAIGALPRAAKGCRRKPWTNERNQPAGWPHEGR